MSDIKDKQEEIKKKILDSATILFTHFGFKKTSVDDIAKKADVAKGTIYNYFKNKEDLFKDVFRQEGIFLISAMREAVKLKKAPEQKLREMIIAKVKHYKDFCLIYDINHQRAEQLLPFIEDERNEISVNEIKLIKEILEEGVRLSLFEVANLHSTAKAMAIAIKGLEISWTLDMDLAQAVKELDELLYILFNGLKK
ncbi:MAG: TetR/AcrR family transcriptional regulator [Desulforegulaceae bacterium]|nr:TetR/AcrR family transcriptional regulator [Desulforegulaceae bacterium]